jgi:hypothetical protein
MDTNTDHQNSDRNSWRVSKEFRGYLGKNSDQKTLNSVVIYLFDRNNGWAFPVIIKMNQNQNAAFLTKILIKTLEEFPSHLNSKF